MWVIRSRIMIGRTGATRLPSAPLTLTAPKGRHVFRQRIDEPETPFLQQRHQRGADDRLGHRVKPKDRIGGHCCAGLLVAQAELPPVHNFPAPGDQRRDPRVNPAIDIRLHRRDNALEAPGVHPHCFGRLDCGVHGSSFCDDGEAAIIKLATRTPSPSLALLP